MKKKVKYIFSEPLHSENVMIKDEVKRDVRFPFYGLVTLIILMCLALGFIWIIKRILVGHW